MTIVAIIAPQTSISHVAEVFFTLRWRSRPGRYGRSNAYRTAVQYRYYSTKPNRGGSLKNRRFSGLPMKNRRSRNMDFKRTKRPKIPETHSRHGFWRFIWPIFPEKKVRKHEKNAWNCPADFI
ncbi:MAG: hypothetical protein QF773_01455 [Lentisphaeria bacterium]|jgi:hypothetical protein|nr:hypothetical protein [Lentisphaeria bacterium]